MSKVTFRKTLPAFALLAFVVAGSAMTAQADPLIAGNTYPNLATANIASFSLAGNVFSFTIQNTSPFDARITGIGFALPGDRPNTYQLTSSSNPNFTLTHDDSNVPQFSSVTLDFALITGTNFAGGNPNQGIDNDDANAATFSVTGDFSGLTANEVINTIYVRFQRVGENGELSDVGRPGAPVPEPASLLLLGTGLVGVVSRLRRKRHQTSRQ
jgi:hypothetical protein